MSDRIKEAFQRVRKDITSANRRIDRTEQKEAQMKQEIAVLMKKYIQAINERVKQELDSREESLKSDINAKLESVKNELNAKFDEFETDIEKGLTSLAEPLKNLFTRVERRTEKVGSTNKEEKEEKKGVFSKMIDFFAED